MIQTKPYQNRIHIFHVEHGKIATFDDIQKAKQYSNWIMSFGKVGNHFVEYQYTHQWGDSDHTNTIYEYNTIIIRDDFGAVVTRYSLYTYKPRRYFKYRGFSGSKRLNRRYYRQLSTTNERRQAYDNYDAYDDYGIVVKPRGQRSVKHLPNSWDDYHRHNSHSWKDHRKTQWVTL